MAPLELTGAMCWPTVGGGVSNFLGGKGGRQIFCGPRFFFSEQGSNFFLLYLKEGGGGPPLFFFVGVGEFLVAKQLNTQICVCVCLSVCVFSVLQSWVSAFR